ncbi:PEP/pyruvate-binding domain-containing protein [Pseudoalteromonas aurantia]|uniref:Phosphoesterase n=3 Tax=Pseudoalteromonas TaxID=53246 RepID=A0A5S3V729_9GAMM|nr:PEP/pyruvate-binding domain-containing protein [Pseudoalteromonas aurantia]TMO62259.1 phosphoesterase [Pseudoalteromonas aurantia]TMO67552.1 phosphoesterase [Pseudoalteromonas aurantia]TMO73325.1 phosphoesterase [Pseudoalteromonas aurantia]
MTVNSLAIGQPLNNGIIHFDSQQAASVEQVGGKGASLCAMHSAGLPVPIGYCITVNLFEEFLQQTQLLSRFDPSKGVTEWRALATAITTVAMPKQIAAQISNASALLIGPVAVRSSATDEDSDSHSFAGQHVTKLAVEGTDNVLEAVKACWASAFSEAAFQYRQTTGHTTDIPKIAVVVQQMQFGDASGVAFGQHPTTFAKNAFVIEACYGLCEGLVSGQVSSDSYEIDKLKGELLAHTVQLKQHQIVHIDGAIKKLAVPPALQNEQVLNHIAQQSLYSVLRQVESYYGCPQDVEWTLSDGKVWLLQSRPITTKNTKTDPFYLGNKSEHVQKDILWSRMDIGEIFTGRMTPLGLSFAHYYQTHVHIDCGKKLGLLDLGEANETIAYHKGHVYLNVSYTAWQLAQTPVGADQTPFLARFSSEAIDLTDYENPYGAKHSHPNMTPKQCLRYWIKQNVKELFQAKRRAKSMITSRYQEFDRVQSQDITTLSHDELRYELDHCLNYFKAMHEGYLPYYINAFACYGLLEELSAKWLGDKSKHLQNKIKGDMSNLRTVASAQELWQLCKVLNAWPQVKDVFTNKDLANIEDFLNSTPLGIRFSNGPLAEFMRDNGVRGREEMELTHPRWLDDRTYVLQMIKLYLKQGYEVDDALVEQTQKQQKISDELLNELSWTQRFTINRVISLYSGCAKLREETRMSMTTSIWLVRRVVYEVARRLIEQSLLSSFDNVAYLDFENVIQYLNNTITAEQLTDSQLISKNRAQYQQWQAQAEPPLTFIGKPSSQPDLIFDPSLTSLKGLATSEGFCRARACVITDLASQAGEFKKGDILIAPFTDASWTPLFALASAVVTDIGSMLSHSSIVAREFGIPCVVNTHHASALINTGDIVTVDAHKGLIIVNKED